MLTWGVKGIPAPLGSLTYEVHPCGYGDHDGAHLSAWKYGNLFLFGHW